MAKHPGGDRLRRERARQSPGVRRGKPPEPGSAGRGLRALDGAIQYFFRRPSHLLVIVPGSHQADELDLAPRRANLGDLPLLVVIETVLPGIDPGLLTVEHQFDDALIREPLEHVLVVLSIEMRIAINRVGAYDHPRDPM